jgi:hypothetical protein
MTDLLPDGVYIGLPEDDYHADPSLGGSALKGCVYDPSEFWWQSAHNPHRPERKESDALAFGKAVHTILLEGREAFEERFYSEGFNADDHPDALDTVEDIKAVLRERSLPLSGKKADLRARLVKDGFDGDFMDDLRDAFETTVEGKTHISEAWMHRLALFTAFREADAATSAIFSEGLPEVSVIWTEQGVRCSARFDWLRKEATWDVKTYSARPGQTAADAVRGSVFRYRYDLQEAHYRRARQMMKDLPIFGGTDGQKDYVEQCAQRPDADFMFLFVKTNGAPVVTRLDAAILGDGAQYDRARLIQALSARIEQWGLDDPWIEPSTDLKIEFTDVPAWLGLEGAA